MQTCNSVHPASSKSCDRGTRLKLAGYSKRQGALRGQLLRSCWVAEQQREISSSRRGCSTSLSYPATTVQPSALPLMPYSERDLSLTIWGHLLNLRKNVLVPPALNLVDDMVAFELLR